MAKKKTLSEFIQQAINIHGDEYDYSLVEYSNAHTKVKILCKLHGIFEQTPKSHISGKAHCPKCGHIQQRLTMLEKYGVENPSCHSVFKNKRKQTMLNRYGVENPSQHIDIHKKQQCTNLIKYGSTTPLQSTQILNKIKQTNLEKYGVEYPFQSTNIQEKIKQTLLTRTKVDQLNVQNKRIATNITKYGVSNYNQSHMIDILPLIQDYDWLFEQYIVQNKTATQIAYELNIRDNTIGRYLKRHEIEIKQTFKYSCQSIYWLESIMEQEGIYIQHAINEGEYQIPGTRYKADGYCQKTNTIYEFYGDYWHGNPNIYESDYINESTNCTMGELYERTTTRENQIISLGYNLISYWESNVYGSQVLSR